jgi:hypothetical protein
MSILLSGPNAKVECQPKAAGENGRIVPRRKQNYGMLDHKQKISTVAICTVEERMNILSVKVQNQAPFICTLILW